MKKLTKCLKKYSLFFYSDSIFLFVLMKIRICINIRSLIINIGHDV